MKLRAVFASGSNHAGEIRGFTEAGWDIGVAAPAVNAAAERELKALAGTGIGVFVDSGAFAEVDFGPAGRTVVKPITHAEWTKRLDLYDRLAVSLGPQLYAVAPDSVGDQDLTEIRLARYAHRVIALARTGATILVPLQKGRRTLAEFHRVVDRLLPGIAWTPAIPSKKDATTLEDVRAYVREMRPATLHLLGMGETSKKWPPMRKMLESVAPGIAVSLDSVRITAAVGRAKGNRKAAPLTAAQDFVLDEMTPDLYADRGGMDATDYTDDISAPESWMTPTARKRFWAAVKDHAGGGRIPDDLDEWLQDDLRYLDPIVSVELDLEWSAHAQKQSTAERKRQAIRRVFAPITPAAAERMLDRARAEMIDAGASARAVDRVMVQNRGKLLAGIYRKAQTKGRP